MTYREDLTAALARAEAAEAELKRMREKRRPKRVGPGWVRSAWRAVTEWLDEYYPSLVALTAIAAMLGAVTWAAVFDHYRDSQRRANSLAVCKRAHAKAIAATYKQAAENVWQLKCIGRSKELGTIYASTDELDSGKLAPPREGGGR